MPSQPSAHACSNTAVPSASKWVFSAMPSCVSASSPCQAVLVHDNRFAVDRARLHRHGGDRVHDQAVAIGEAVSVAGVEPHAVITSAPGDNTEAVVLDFVHLAGTGRRRCGRAREAWGDRAFDKVGCHGLGAVATGWTMARRCSEDHCRRRRTGHEWKRRRSGRTGGARKASALGIAARFSRRLCRFQSRHIPKDCCGSLNPIATSRGIAGAGGGCDFSAFKVRRLLIFLATKAPLRSPLGARCFLRKRSATNRFR
jgi:hypothetical protein